MENQIDLPKLNPIRFQKTSWDTFQRYISAMKEDYPFKTQKLPAIAPKQYAQKWQHIDILRFQVAANFPEDLDVRLMNIKKKTIKTFHREFRLTSKVHPEQPWSQFALSFATIDSGCYVVRITDNEPDGVHYLSDPLIVAEKHPNTLLIKYFNLTREGGVIFMPEAPFNFRIEGRMKDMDPSDERAQGFSKARDITIGGVHGLGPFYLDLYKSIYACDKVAIDGHQLSDDRIGYFDTYNNPDI